jgi:CRP-like cAMP-binding protein
MSSQMKIVSNTPLDPPSSPLHCLKKIEIFSNLADEEVAPFQNAAQIRSYKKGRFIYLQGDPATFFYVVGGGWIKLFRTMPEGQEVIIDMLTTGHTFGEDAIFEQGRHACSAQVVEDVKLLSIPANLLKEQTRRNPSLAINMLATISKQHRHHSGALAFNAMLSAPQRIGCFLLRLCLGDTPKGAVFNLPYDKSLIADTLGMKGATFSRALAILKQKTDVRVKGTRVEIDCQPRLWLDHSRYTPTVRERRLAA